MIGTANIAVARARIADVVRRRSCLTAAELDRASRLSSRNVSGFVAGRTLLRQLLGRALARDPLAIELVEPDGGKPHLADQSLDFNLAHGGAWVVVAIARGCKVGVDVEPLDLSRDASAIAAAFELAVDPAIPFAKQWVRIEARYKAAGIGLEIPIDPTVGADFTVADLDIAPDHAAAIAWNAATATIHHIKEAS